MSTIRRNQSCPCGSGKKYKKCHGAITQVSSPWDDPHFREAFDQNIKELKALHAQREKQQGLGRPIVAAKFNDHQLVAVGNRVFFSPQWKTFHDFLRDHFFGLLGQKWFETERAKPFDERHRILQWFDQAMEDTRRTGIKAGDIQRAPMTGAIRAFINLAYNIYLIAHHAGVREDAIIKSYIDRLKSPRTDDFAGALFETYAASAFLKAGFTLEFENERDGKISHVEFVALYPKTGKRFSVEVKTRGRAAGKEKVDEIKRLRVANKLNKALGKAAAHTRVIMIEVNVPDMVTSFEGWPVAAMDQIRYNEKIDFPDGTKKPSAYVFVTNHAFHNNLTLLDSGLQILAAGFHLPDFGPDAQATSYTAVLKARERHSEMFALLKSMQTHYEIPATFNGEMPQLAFGGPDGPPRLQFGRWYPVPLPDGREVAGRLRDATVNESKKEVVGVYELESGESVLVSCPLSDDELMAYRQYPETFFGEIRTPGTRANNLVELCDFFYDSYKNTPREKLLEWLAAVPDIEHLRSLSQEDLAILVCERWALAAFQKRAS